ncbi:MAG: class F sortase [Actinobacteria bacterium]|nr:class F sortase [Actinomycetota bacterium]
MQRRLRATVRRRFALVLLLVVGGGVVTLILLSHGERSGVASSETPPAGGVTTAAPPDTIPAPPPEVVAQSAPGKQYAPMRIEIPAIAASAPVDPLGLNPDGTLAVPTDFARAGYYTGRPPPGAVGPAIIVAHVDSKTGPAVFKRLRQLKPGDEVTVTRADRSTVIFVVDGVVSYPKRAFPTNAVYDPTPGATLRLITCGGSFDRKAGHYRDNVIAFAHYKTLTPPSAGA